MSAPARGPDPEHRLLLAAATPGDGPLAAPLEAVDWDRVLPLARHHRLDGLLHRLIERRRLAVPDSVREACRAERQRNAARALAAQIQLRDIAAALASADVPVVALKGASLIETVYREPGLRPLMDLDLLLSRTGLDTAVLALAHAGYVPHPYWRAASMQQTFGRLAPHHHVPLRHPHRPLTLELHHAITAASAPTSTAGFLARSQSSPNGAHRLPDPTDLLLHLAAHFSGDRLGGSDGALGQLADLAHTIEAQSICWDALAKRAERCGCGALVFLALRTVSALGLAPVPAAQLSQLEPDAWDPVIGERLIADRVLRAVRPAPMLSVLPPTLRDALLPSRAYLQANHRLPAAPLHRLIFKRARVAAGMIAGAVAHPRGSRADIRLDRWIRRHAVAREPGSPIQSASPLAELGC